MNYHDFKKELLKGLRDKYGDTAAVDVRNVVKNNGVTYEGLWISRYDEAASVMPLFYLEQLYTYHVRQHYTVNECVEVISNYEKSRDREPENNLLEKISDKEYVCSNVYPKVCSRDKNAARMEHYVHREFLDLTICYIIRIEEEDRMYSATISKHMLDGYGMTEEELHECALRNMENDGYGIRSVESCLTDILGEPEFENEMGYTMAEPEHEMLVLTNRSKQFGAAAVLNKGLLQKASRGRNLIVLPSSIHEILVVPDVPEEDLEVMDGFVRSVNEENVLQEEQLADHCYFYDAARNEVRMRRAVA